MFKPPVVKVEVEVNVKEISVRVQGASFESKEFKVESVAGSSSEVGRGSGDCSAAGPARDEDVLDGLADRLNKRTNLPEVKFGAEKND